MAKGRVKTQQINAFADWLVTPAEDRHPKTKADFARQMEVTEATLCIWEAELEKSGDIDEVNTFKRHLYKMAMKPNATAKHMELYAKLNNLLVEKSEAKVFIELSADERARQHFEAKRRLREAGYTVVDVSGESTLLPEQVCLDTEQDHSQDS